ncbi:hypothetical protein HBI67_136950 [Parastagonospora nodorum]|nr:hypothetical protein HBI66_198580 [Parastagonospora nodorum]KAH6063190.1 hypothetical protein HBI67_136950 [Parastagonospora nodorum]
MLVGIILVAQMTWAIVDEGSGKHQSDIRIQNIAALAKSLIVNEVLWSITGALIRISGCYVAQMLVGYYIFIATLGLCIFHGIASVLEICLICRPLAAQWDTHVRGVCGNQIVSFTVVEVSALALDLAILISPLSKLLRMQMTFIAKIKTIVLFDAGIV